MNTGITSRQIDDAVKFHGHQCPGLWIGIRAAEICINRLGAHTDRNPMLCVVETDMCGVDAIQVITGCTFGKGNLIHRDYGKSAFTFYNRTEEAGLRVVLKPTTENQDRVEMRKLTKSISSGTAAPDARERLTQLRDKMCRQLMNTELEDLFSINPSEISMPGPARIHESKSCEHCGEMTMETRVRLLGGRVFCMPCFERMEQKY